jgi:hypothetical protein
MDVNAATHNELRTSIVNWYSISDITEYDKTWPRLTKTGVIETLKGAVETARPIENVYSVTY